MIKMFWLQVKVQNHLKHGNYQMDEENVLFSYFTDKIFPQPNLYNFTIQVTIPLLFH